MRNLYLQIGYCERIDDVSVIQLGIAGCRAPQNATIAQQILLNPDRKEIYDQSHQLLQTIGELRHRLDIPLSEAWSALGNEDFEDIPSSPETSAEEAFSDPIHGHNHEDLHATKDTFPFETTPEDTTNHFRPQEFQPAATNSASRDDSIPLQNDQPEVVPSTTRPRVNTETGRKQKNQSTFRTTSAARHKTSQVVTIILSVTCVTAIVLLGLWVLNHPLAPNPGDSPPQPTLPPTGIVQWFDSKEGTIPFQIRVAFGDEHVFVMLKNAQSGNLVTSIFVRRNEIANFKVPAGEYTLEHWSGHAEDWQNTTLKFGPRSNYKSHNFIHICERKNDLIKEGKVELDLRKE